MMKTAIKGASAEINFYIVGRKKMPGLRFRSKHPDMNTRIQIRSKDRNSKSGSKFRQEISILDPNSNSRPSR